MYKTSFTDSRSSSHHSREPTQCTCHCQPLRRTLSKRRSGTPASLSDHPRQSCVSLYLYQRCLLLAPLAPVAKLLEPLPILRARNARLSVSCFPPGLACGADSGDSPPARLARLYFPVGPPCRCLQETHRASPTAHLRPLANNQTRSPHFVTVTSSRSGRALRDSYPDPYPYPYPDPDPDPPPPPYPLRFEPPCCCPPYPEPCRPPAGRPAAEYEACRVDAPPPGRPE